LLKKCRTLFREHRQALWGSHPVPLLPTEVAGIYANEFPGENKRLWTFYNETAGAVEACVLRVEPRPGCHFLDVWTDREAEVAADGSVRLRLEPRGLGGLVELPRRLAYAGAEGTLRVAGPQAGMLIELRQSGASQSMPAGPALDLAGWLRRGEPLSARLLLDGELLDQIVIQPGTASP
jgi:hypothetical protein